VGLDVQKIAQLAERVIVAGSLEFLCGVGRESRKRGGTSTSFAFSRWTRAPESIARVRRSIAAPHDCIDRTVTTAFDVGALTVYLPNNARSMLRSDMSPARPTLPATLRERLAAVICSSTTFLRITFVRSVRSRIGHGGGNQLSEEMQPPHEQSHEASTEPETTDPTMQPSPTEPAQQPTAAIESDSPDTGEISEEPQTHADAGSSDTAPSAETVSMDQEQDHSDVDALVPAFETQLRRASDVITAAERAAEAVGLTTAATGGRIECDYDMVADTLICKSVSFDLEF
jgi:hypothetical protein